MSESIIKIQWPTRYFKAIDFIFDRIKRRSSKRDADSNGIARYLLNKVATDLSVDIKSEFGFEDKGAFDKGVQHARKQHDDVAAQLKLVNDSYVETKRIAAIELERALQSYKDVESTLDITLEKMKKISDVHVKSVRNYCMMMDKIHGIEGGSPVDSDVTVIFSQEDMKEILDIISDLKKDKSELETEIARIKTETPGVMEKVYNQGCSDGYDKCMNEAHIFKFDEKTLEKSVQDSAFSAAEKDFLSPELSDVASQKNTTETSVEPARFDSLKELEADVKLSDVKSVVVGGLLPEGPIVTGAGLKEVKIAKLKPSVMTSKEVETEIEDRRNHVKPTGARPHKYKKKSGDKNVR